MENEKGIVKLTRKQLYDEIWALSVAGVARKYNLNYGKLIATCKVENISFPSSGYWTKKNMGKDVSNEIVEFSGLEDTEISLITKDAVVKLRIVFGERSYIRDNDSEKLEDRLGDILVTLYEKAEENRIVREAREEAERKRVEEARRREENRQRKEQEIRLVKELVNKAEDYRIAKEIREYIQAMIDSGNEDITPAWIEWARKKADWYDPSIATEDEYLGKRQHEKNAEEKEKSLQDSIRKSWYW